MPIKLSTNYPGKTATVQHCTFEQRARAAQHIRCCPEPMLTVCVVHTDQAVLAESFAFNVLLSRLSRRSSDH